MGYIDVAGVGYTLPDGRELFKDVSFRVGEGAKVALVGPNGAGKTTLLRMVAGDLPSQEGGIARVGGLGVMRQFFRPVAGRFDDDVPWSMVDREDATLAELAMTLAPVRVRAAGLALARAEAALSETEKSQMRYATALSAWGEVGGYEAEVAFDTASVSVLDLDWERARHRLVRTLSGGEQKRFVLELLLRGPDEVLLLDEPDNFLDVPAKRWLEQRLKESPKSVLYVSHDRELLANTADRVVAVEGGSAWTHVGGFASWHDARVNRHDSMEETRRRWDEEHQKLKDLVLMYKQKAAYNDGLASRYQAAKTRLAKFEGDGPPPLPPKDQDIKMRLDGGRTAKRSVICEQLELDDLTFPFDFEVWYGDRVAVLGANGTGKSHFLRLLGRGGTDPLEVPLVDLAPVAHGGVARLGARVRPGHFSQVHDRPELHDKTLVEILWRGDDYRTGKTRHDAMKVLDRYELAGQGDQTFGTLSGGQQARFLVLMLELSGATLLLLDEPTDNLDLASAEALEEGLKGFEGTVIAVTHDRWFTRGFDRFLLFGTDGEVTEVPEPVWDVR
ncbi:putative ABC transporter ATP-binding protein [Longispora fulva]|uniref:ATPase subunit of ABC transporter with duplicated ATPase domains n=1 Tax=Longispora fulva TaxID=619741 RepID=A0A8J7GZG8_9ACTN|nr:ATP-binding cassette domain-containing protein [Longispora fulva]MBG6140113.1 ATPase subunit of ABC transporter with duplicated ATPase domains [Longispora fulva]GIG57511.1 putative ABC transporter ATP-binding protein [Longispora fulva]